jgi:hypothetical protein
MLAQCQHEFIEGDCGAKTGFDKLNLTSSVILRWLLVTRQHKNPVSRIKNIKS